MALPGFTKTPGDQLPDVKPSVAHLKVFDGTTWERSPEGTRRALDAKVGYVILLQFLSYGMICSIFEVDQNVEKTRPCFVKENVFHSKQ